MVAVKFLSEDKGKEGPLGLHQLEGKVLIDEDISGDRWYECFPKWPEEADGGPRGTKTQWRDVAVKALSATNRIFEKTVMQRNRKTDIQDILKKEKTVADKIAAVTLSVQESPLHRFDELQLLFSFVKKKGRRERSPAIDAFKDLLINDLLPDDRRLVRFDDRYFNCGQGGLSKRHLAYALFEDELKTLCQSFLDVLEECGRDSVAHFKLKAVSVIFDLLVAKPENERQLLSMLVNKLGDPERKVASNAGYYLRLLVEKHHPRMKIILVREVEELLHRRNVGRRTQYYAISFLNQLRFGNDDVELSRLLISIYMGVLSICVDADKKRETIKRQGGAESKETRLMGALLTGVNRAFPYTQPDTYDPSLNSHYDTLFRIAHAKSISSSTQALAFLFQISKCQSTISDRFYRALYSRIQDLSSAGESKQALLLNLIFKAMKTDVSSRRVKAFIKRLLQTALQSPPGLAGGILVLLSEILTHRKHLGMLKSSTEDPEGYDDDEVFRDVDSDADSDVGDNSLHEKRPKKKSETPLNKGDVAKRSNSESLNYDFDAREPLHARAERSSFWELVPLCSYNHPSVSMFATSLCSTHESIKYGSDPLADFALTPFLEKFSFKKPKKRLSTSLHGRRTNNTSGALLEARSKFFDLIRSGEQHGEDGFFARFFANHPEKLDSVAGKQKVKMGQDKSSVPDGNEENGLSGDDSEEEAFERAMHEEMRRLGGGTSSTAGGGDIDEEDPDELEAFEEAFREDIDNIEELDEEMSASDAEIERIMNPSKVVASGSKANRKKRKLDSVFAAMSDYEAVIEDADKEDDNSAEMDDVCVADVSGHFKKQAKTPSVRSSKPGQTQSARRAQKSRKRKKRGKS